MQMSILYTWCTLSLQAHPTSFAISEDSLTYAPQVIFKLGFPRLFFFIITHFSLLSRPPFHAP